MSETSPRTFECAVCHETFEVDPDFTAEQARAEYEELHHQPFPGMDKVGITCDDCAVEVIAWAKGKGLLP